MFVKYAILPAADLDRAVAFYTGMLRLTLTGEAQAGNSERCAELTFPNGETRLRLETGLANSADRPPLTLGVPDLDAAVERLSALGVTFIVPPDDQPHRAAFRDSEGNLVLIEPT